MRDTISQGLNSQLRGKDFLMPGGVGSDKLVDIASQRLDDLVIGAFVVFVLGEREDVIDVVDEGLRGNCSQGLCTPFAEVLTVFLYQEVSVVYQVAVELA